MEGRSEVGGCADEKQGSEGEKEERKMREEGRCVFSCCIVGGFTHTVLSLALQRLLATLLFLALEGQTVISGNVEEQEEEKEQTASLSSKIFMA